MTQQNNLIYRDHAAKSSSRPNLTEEGGEHAPAGCNSSLQTNIEMNLMYRIMFGLRCELGSCSVLICWDVELIWKSASFSLPCGILATGPNTVRSDLIRRSNSFILCLHGAEVSHLLYATFTVWMSGNNRSKCQMHYFCYDRTFLLQVCSCFNKPVKFIGALEKKIQRHAVRVRVHL